MEDPVILPNALPLTGTAENFPASSELPLRPPASFLWIDSNAIMDLGTSELDLDDSFDQEEIQQILASLDDLRKGRYKEFDDVEKLIADLHSS